MRPIRFFAVVVTPGVAGQPAIGSVICGRHFVLALAPVGIAPESPCEAPVDPEL